MKKIQELLMCPECKSGLSVTQVCEKCGNKFSFEQGVFDVVSPKSLSNQEWQWEITDEMLKDKVEAAKKKAIDGAYQMPKRQKNC